MEPIDTSHSLTNPSPVLERDRVAVVLDGFRDEFRSVPPVPLGSTFHGVGQVCPPWPPSTAGGVLPSTDTGSPPYEHGDCTGQFSRSEGFA